MFFGGRGGGFPFGDFEEMGGMPGGMGGPRGPKKEVDNETYYKRLGVEKTASYDEIRKAFRKLALKQHPDRGGDKEKFQELQQAYEVLGDKEKRDLYDKYGEDGLKEGGGGGMDINDLFGFGGGGRRQQQSGPKKGKPVMHPMKLTLEEIYNGKTAKLAVNRERMQKIGDHNLSKEDAVKRCDKCKGRGMVIKMQQLGPGMYTQSQAPCDECRGKGQIMDDSKWKIVKEKKILEVQIDKGTPNNYQYKFNGEADELPGQEAGDVVIVCQEQPHKKFKRKGADLMFQKTITLAEALTGVDFTLTHLDGSLIRIKNKPGEVIKPEDLKTVEDKGLPFHKKSWEFGNLFIIFKVTFPDSLGQPQIKALNAALGKEAPDDDDMPENSETVFLKKFDKEQENTHAQGGTRANDSEDDEEEDDGRHGQQIPCQQA